MKVFKYAMRITDDFELELPAGARFLHMGTQGTSAIEGNVFGWFQVDPSAPKVKRRFKFVGTGHEFDPSGLVHLGTIQIPELALVFHLYEDEDRNLSAEG